MSQHEYNLEYNIKPLPGKLMTIGISFLIVGLVLAIASYVADPVRASYSSLISFMFGFSICFGIMFLIGIEHLSGAVWSVPFRRGAEIFGGIIYVIPIFAIPVLLNIHHIFHWTDTTAVAKDHILTAKSPYLNINFFYVRLVAIILISWFFFTMLKKNSKAQDSTFDAKFAKRNTALSAMMMPFFAVSLTLLAIDFLMSLEPHWFSTIFGVYYFAGSFLAGLGAVTFLSVKLADGGYLMKGLKEDNFYSFGAFMFAITNFWAYIAFSQFMLIWYANLPEETFWFMPRLNTSWAYFSFGLIIVKFIVPYIFLLSQPSKMDKKRLTYASLWILFGHYYDLYYVVMPNFYKDGIVFSWNEIGFPILLIGVCIVYFAIAAKNKNLIPIGDKKLYQGINFHL